MNAIAYRRTAAYKRRHRAECLSHYQRNKKYYRERNKRRTAENKRRVDQIKTTTPCADCGKTYPPYVMDFDHVRGKKRFNISRMIPNRTWPTIERELIKCEIVCANCHRIRTHERRNIER